MRIGVRACREALETQGGPRFLGLEQQGQPRPSTSTRLTCGGVTGAGLEALKALRQLESLGLSFCKGIDDAAVSQLAAWPGLKALLLNGCEAVADAGLALVARLGHLQRLGLGWQGLTDAGLAALSALDGLRTLTMTAGMSPM